MALITCPECNRDCSDTIKSCPHCGFRIAPVKIVQNGNTERTDTPSAGFVKNNLKKIIIAASSLIVIVFLVVLTVNLINKNNERKYITKMNIVLQRINIDSFFTENLAKNIIEIWHNSNNRIRSTKTDKYTRLNNGLFYSNMNTVLANYFNDDSTKKFLMAINFNSHEIRGMMKELENPPKKLQQDYDELYNLFEAISSYSVITEEPRGTLNEYKSSIDFFPSMISNMYIRLNERFKEYPEKIPFTELDSIDFYNEFYVNPFLTEVKYRDRVVMLKGELFVIEDNEYRNKIYLRDGVTLEGGVTFISAVLGKKENNKFKKLKKGDEVKVVGKLSKEDIMSFIIYDARIVK